LLSRDEAPGIVVAAAKIGYARFGRTGGFTPIPILFSSDPQEALEAAKDGAMEEYIQLLASRLMIREELSAAEAEAFITSPRAGRVLLPLSDLWKKSKLKREASRSEPLKVDKGKKVQLDLFKSQQFREIILLLV